MRLLNIKAKVSAFPQDHKAFSTKLCLRHTFIPKRLAKSIKCDTFVANYLKN